MIKDQNKKVSCKTSKTHKKKLASDPLPLYDLDILTRGPPTQISRKNYGIISGFSANTNMGKVRNYNEDRISIAINLKKPSHFVGKWSKSSFFGLYDGHGGAGCADFLKNNLHHYIIKDPNFPEYPQDAILSGFQQAERDFLAQAEIAGDTSGSCAVIALYINNTFYIANLGDSRAILSKKGKIYQLTNDHKPSDTKEAIRIREAGGMLYRGPVGPLRVKPGRLSVSRTFGNIDAKCKKHGGIPGVLSCTPDIKMFKVTKDEEFLFLGCDGIFDTMSNDYVNKIIWNTEKISNENRHKMLGSCSENVIIQAGEEGSKDNLTGILVAFSSFMER